MGVSERTFFTARLSRRNLRGFARDAKFAERNSAVNSAFSKTLLGSPFKPPLLGVVADGPMVFFKALNCYTKSQET
jgi:hypothetical protein